MIVRGLSRWHGSFRQGDGTISTSRDTLRNAPYTFASRFEGADGACPEELLAAAHAACFNHALANISGLQELVVDTILTTAEVTMGRDDKGPAILGVHLKVEARLPGVSTEQFEDVAEKARLGCAFSKALCVPITMEARLAGSH